MSSKFQETFDRIEADSRLKESTKQFLKKERGRRSRMIRRPVVVRGLAAACLFLVAILGIGGYTWIQTPVSYVSIDINPSIELALNRLDRVVSATAYNPEGEVILNNLSLEGKKYGEAIHALMESEDMKPYLTEGEELVLTVAAEEKREWGLVREAEHCLQRARCTSFSVSTDVALVSAAHDNGLSLGKYYAYLQLAKYDETVTPDTCRDMSMSHIHDLIQEHEHGSGHQEKPEGEHSKEPWGGHHQGPGEASDPSGQQSDAANPAGQEQTDPNGQQDHDGQEQPGPESEENRGHHGQGGHH